MVSCRETVWFPQLTRPALLPLDFLWLSLGKGGVTEGARSSHKPGSDSPDVTGVGVSVVL